MEGAVQVGKWVVAPLEFYLAKIDTETPDFKDDGLSCFPDWIYRYILRFNLTPAGRVHDWHYCARAQPQGTMNQKRRLFVDVALREHAREIIRHPVPTDNRFLRFVRRVRCRVPRLAPWILYRGVRWFGGTSAWNSCGPTKGERCRHNLQMPGWMRALG